MPKLLPGPFANDHSRQLIGRVLRENFHLYRQRYLLAFLLMGGAAAATGLSAFLMERITMVVFGRHEMTPASSHAQSFLNSNAAGRWLQALIDSARDALLPASPGMAAVAQISLAVLFVFFLKGICQYGSNVILAKIGNNIVARQQQRISNHLLNQSLAFFVRYPSSDLLGRVSRAASGAREVMNLLMMRVQDVFTTAALLFAMFKLDWKLSCCALFIMAPVIGALGSIIRRVKKIANAEFQGSIQVIATLQEAVLGTKLIKSYNLEEHMRGRFRDSIGTVEQRANKMAVVSARTSPVMEFMGGVAVAVIVFYGGYRNVVLGQSADSLIAFLTALLLAYEPVKRIARMNVGLQSALVGVEMLYEVLDQDLSIPEPSEVPHISIARGEVALHQVSFSYLPGQPVLRDVSITCPAGKVTALVGPSGSGKSTVLALIEKFWLPDSGRVTIDGTNLSEISAHSLRCQVSLVSQDTFLFADTIRNNIRLARPDASDSEIEMAARAANAHEFISGLPLGYDTPLGENGGNLSGGQRQRISIARAFLKNAPVLLLDEATSALDSESEAQIQAAFDQLMQGRTTIAIAHRLSTIRNAAVIHVMQDGRVVESGSHDSLTSNPDGLYAQLHRLQHAPAMPG